MPSLIQVLTYVTIPVVAILVGGIIAVFYSPGPRLSSSIQHFAAGLVFAAVATELLPEILAAHDRLAMSIGFAVGIIAMLGIKWFAQRTGQKGVHKAEQPTSLVFATAVDLAVDGMLIGLGFVLGAKTGGLLTFALTIEVLFLTLAVTSALRREGTHSSRLITTAFVFALLLALGAVVGVTILGGLTGPVLVAVLAFGAAALIYLVTEELLVEAHEHHVPEDPVTVALFFIGFLLLLIVEMSV